MEEVTDWMKGNNSNLKAVNPACTVEVPPVLTQRFGVLIQCVYTPCFYIIICLIYSKGFDLHTYHSLSRYNFMVIISKAANPKELQ